MGKKPILKKIKETLSKEINIEKIFLFGSRARGDYYEDSDYDIAIVSPDFKEKSFMERQKLIRPLIRNALGDVSLDVICYSPDEYEKGKQKNGFLPNIIQEEGLKA